MLLFLLTTAVFLSSAILPAESATVNETCTGQTREGVLWQSLCKMSTSDSPSFAMIMFAYNASDDVILSTKLVGRTSVGETKGTFYVANEDGSTNSTVYKSWAPVVDGDVLVNFVVGYLDGRIVVATVGRKPLSTTTTHKAKDVQKIGIEYQGDITECDAFQCARIQKQNTNF